MKDKEIILIRPFYKVAGGNEGAVGPPLGLMYIASFLEKDAHSVGIVDAQVNRFNLTQTVKAVLSKAAAPILIGLYINSFNQKACGELVIRLRQIFPGTVIVAGGPVPTSIPERILDDISPDYIVRGEGEFALRDLVRQLKGNSIQPIRSICGLIPQDKSVPLDSRTARITNLDDLPFPAYHLLGDIRGYLSSSRGKPFATVITSRGCQYDCDFCSKDVFKNNVTRRSIPNVMAEIDELVKRYGVKQIDFVDDNLANHRHYFDMLLDEILKRDYKIWFNVTSGMRSEILDKELLSKMRKANFYSLALGIESADQDLLNMHNKCLNIDLMESKISLAKSLGFLVYGFFIIGLPGETEGSFQKTLEFIKKTRIDMAAFMIAMPFPGTKMLGMVKEKGKLLVDVESGINEGFYGGRCFFSYPGLEPRDVIRRYKTAYRKFFSVRKIYKLFIQYKGILEYRWFMANGLSVIKNMFKKDSWENVRTNTNEERIKTLNHFEKMSDVFDSIYESKQNSFLYKIIDASFRKNILERRRKLILNLAGDVRGKDVLDIGCGSGRYVVCFAENSPNFLLGLDISPAMIGVAQRLAAQYNVARVCQFENYDFLQKEFVRKFDIIVAAGVFDYTPDPQKFLLKIKDILKEKALLSFPVKWSILTPLRMAWLQKRGCPNYYYSPRRLRSLFKECGLKIDLMQKIGSFLVPGNYIIVCSPIGSLGRGL